MADTEAPTPTLGGAWVAVGLNGVVDMIELGLSGKATDDAVCLRGVVMVDIGGLGFRGKVMVVIDELGFRGTVDVNELWLEGIAGEEVIGLGFGDTNMVDIVGLGFTGNDMMDVAGLGFSWVVMVGEIGIWF